MCATNVSWWVLISIWVSQTPIFNFSKQLSIIPLDGSLPPDPTIVFLSKLSNTPYQPLTAGNIERSVW
jgi:hypothetical protein